MRYPEDPDFPDLKFHQLSWVDFDELASGKIRSDVLRRLRRVERSQRLLLLRALLDEVLKEPELFGSLPSPEEAWDLLERVDARAPAASDLVVTHPYTGSWAGYTIRILRRRISGTCPLWMHVGHLHAIAAAAAIHGALDFRISVPVWEGGVILPTLGLARLPGDEPHSVAEVRSDHGRIEIAQGDTRLVLASPLDVDTPDWSSIRRVTTTVGRHRLTVRLDDLDPYRGLHEPVLPQRLRPAEVEVWQDLLAGAWRLIAHYLPELADAFPAGLDSIVPSPAAGLRSGSASTSEAFGSALISRPDDAATLAATLVHEFQHIVLGGVLHVTHLYDDDPRERFYVPWRPDPRPLGGTLQGVYAFFGIAAFWREIAYSRTGDLARRAMFEFARSRSQTWRVLCALHDDARLTAAGRRFVDGIASRLEPWQEEPVPDDLRQFADAVNADHYASWRMRHLRPSPHAVAVLTEAWLAGRARPPILQSADPMPTPVQDGTSSNARTDLVHLRFVMGNTHELTSIRQSVPDATTADLAFATRRFADAAQGYRAELAADPDRVSSWVGLGLALAALGADPAARALAHHPELVRAVRRRISATSSNVPTPERLATWIGQSMH